MDDNKCTTSKRKTKTSIGDKRGKLLIVGYSRNTIGRLMYVCQCECGNVKHIRSDSLNRPTVTSCGCDVSRVVFGKDYTCDDCPPFPNNSEIEFRHCDGIPGICVGSDGSVWSCRSLAKRGPSSEWHKLAPGTSSRGYRRISVWQKTPRPRVKCYLVAHLVAEAFHGARPAGLVVRHLDGNQEHDAADNLAWGTNKENQQDASKHGASPGFQRKGIRHPMAKLCDEDIRNIRRLAKTMSQESIAAMFKVSPSMVYNIVKRLNWSHVSD